MRRCEYKMHSGDVHSKTHQGRNENYIKKYMWTNFSTDDADP